MSVDPDEPPSVELVLDGDHRLVIRKRAADPAARARLRHEHAVLDRFRHPGAVTVMSFTDDSATTALTLGWAGPRTLGDISSPTIEEAATVVGELATTVADAHAKGLVHRRIDPSHVIIDESGRPILCGWAGATFVDDGAETEAAARPADDVHDLGRLLIGLVGSASALEPVAQKWRVFRRHQRSSGSQRRALLTLADQAIATDARVRPTARRLAAALTETIPGARPMPLSTNRGAPTDHDDEAVALHDEHARATPPNGARSATPVADTRPEASDPHLSHSAGVIGSRSAPHADPGEMPSPHAVRHVRARLGERWRARRHRTPRRWMPVAAVSVIAVLTAIVITSLLRGRPVTIGSSPRRAGDAARPAPPTASGSTPGDSTLSPTAPSPAGRAAPSPSVAVRPGGEASTTTSLPPNCHPPSGAVADVNGDGCPEPVRIVGNTLITPLRELAAGQRGDQVVLGDWWCRGRVTPAVLRPTTGEVFVFASWPQPGADITITPTTTVTRATGIDVDHRGSCDVVQVQRAGRGPVDVNLPREGLPR